jgi:hypothetical protein
MTSDSRRISKSQFVNEIRPPTAAAIRDRSSDWELNPFRRAVEHGKLVKRQKSSVSLSKSAVPGSNALGTNDGRIPSMTAPPSFRINHDGTIRREDDASNGSAPASNPALSPAGEGSKTSSSHSRKPQGGEIEHVGCSCFSGFGFRFRGREPFPFYLAALNRCFAGLFAQQTTPTPNMLLLRHHFSSHQLPTFPT